jgi:hypothetical protein
MKRIPFVPNRTDDLHCVHAVFRMIHRYYFGKDLTWSQIDKISYAQKGKGTWTFPLETYVAKKGLTVRNFEPLDFQKLYEEGGNYLKKVVGKEPADYYLKKSNLTSVLQFIPEYLASVQHETRQTSLDEIIHFLTEGCIIAVEVNSCALNNVPGFALHLVLLYDFANGMIEFHDPGLPPYPARKITIDQFIQCSRYPGAGGAITVFSR